MLASPILALLQYVDRPSTNRLEATCRNDFRQRAPQQFRIDSDCEHELIACIDVSCVPACHACEYLKLRYLGNEGKAQSCRYCRVLHKPLGVYNYTKTERSITTLGTVEVPDVA